MAPANRVVRAGLAGMALLIVAATGWIVLSGRTGSPPPAETTGPGRGTAAPAASSDSKARDASLPVPASAVPARGVSGRVIHLGGGPAAGASVVLFPGGGRLPSYPAPAAGERVDPALLRDLFRLDEPESVAAVHAALVPTPAEAAPGSPAVGKATSGTDGAFEIPVEGDGPFHLEASLEGAGAVAIDGVPAHGPPLTVVLGSAATLRGVVLEGRSRTPVAAATVLATRGRVVRQATSGADGAFEIHGLTPGPCGLLASAAGYPSVRLRGVDVPTERGPVEVVFGPSRTLLVRVTRRESRPANRRPRGPARESRQGDLGPERPVRAPVAGATVVAWQEESGTYASAVTGGDGRARLERLGAGSWNIAARAEGLLTGFANSSGPGAEGAEEETCEIVLEPAVPRTVRVVDATWPPVAGAEVHWGGPDREFDLRRGELAGRTVGDGTVRVVFDEGIPGKSALWVLPPEGAAMRVEPSPRDEGGEVKAVVRPGRVVRGTVRDGEGNPVPAATVTLRVEHEERALGVGLRTATDGAGSYAFPRVAFGAVRVGVEGEAGFAEERREGSAREDPLVVDFGLGNLRE